MYTSIAVLIQDLAQDNLALFLSMLIGVILLALLSYVVESFSLIKLAKKVNVKNTWLAFIPVVRMYIYGKIAFKDKIRPCLLVLLNCVSIATLAITNSGFKDKWTLVIAVLNVFQWANVFLTFHSLYKIYKKFSDKAVIMLILSVLTDSIIAPIFLFAIRNNELREPAKQ